MVIDTNTGLITWDNPTLGTTNIQLTATDTSGAVAAQGYTLTGKQNQAPVINSTPKTQVTIGNTYRYDVIAKDPDNDALTYRLDTAATTAGVSIDKLGRITWKPTTPNIGIQPVTITVADTIGAAVAQTYNLEVLADNTAPVINLLRGTNIADIGETISFQVNATDNVGIKSKQLLINNQAVTLDSNGVGTYTVTAAGIITATAIVTDLNGNISTANTTTNVLDTTDIEAPNIKLDLSGIVDGIITGRTDIKGTVTDTNLDYYTLEVARLGTNNWQEVFNGLLLYKGGKLFNLAGRPYVPQDDGFGNRYILTTKDGTVYEINATTGDLESVTDTNGNVLTYSDTEIKSSTGVSVTFERDNQGRIVSVTDPLGQKVLYGYDAKGDLVSVTDRDGNETKFHYDATRSHYLDKIVDPLGREAVKTEYDEAGRLKKTANSSGNGVEFVYNPNNSLETVKDALGNPTTYEYDSRGNVVTEVDALGGITHRTYDDDTNLLSETDAEGNTKSYTYDSSRNRLTETDGLGNTTRYTYNGLGEVTEKVNALGQTTKYEYDAKGNQTATINAIGKTSSIFDREHPTFYLAIEN